MSCLVPPERCRNHFLMVGLRALLLLAAAVTLDGALVSALNRSVTGSRFCRLLALLALAQAAAVSGTSGTAATRTGLRCFLAFGGGHNIILDCCRRLE